MVEGTSPIRATVATLASYRLTMFGGLLALLAALMLAVALRRREQPCASDRRRR